MIKLPISLNDFKNILLACLVAIFILYVDCFFIIKPQLKFVRQSKQKIADLKKEIQDYPQNLALMQRNQNKKESAVLPKRIIAESELPQLLQEISRQADLNKVRIMQIKSSKEKATPEQGSPAQAGVNPVLINLELSCGFHRLGSFIAALENNQQFMVCESLRIVKDPANELLQNASLQIRTYVKK